MDIVRRVLDFWFGQPDAPARWFRSTPAFDDEVRRRFQDDWRRARAGDLDGLLASADGALALVIVLDQFPRNMFRGRPEAFASDGHALAMADAAIRQGHDAATRPQHRRFFYLPFEHSESLADQERSLELFRRLGEPEALDYALRHRDIVVRFGRFPHRNAILGRASTPQEIAFLKQPGSSF